MKTFKILTFNFAIFFILLEIGSFIFTELNYFKINEVPTIYRSEKYLSLGNWKTENSVWGAWHRANKMAYHSSSCFSVSYQSNEVGARDEAFTNLNEGTNILLIGDSFAEGFASAKDKTAEVLIEKKLNLNLLNFGASENFGPLQYYLIYKNLAKNYKHDAVLIFLLPNNDFTDNDYQYWVSSRQAFLESGLERYRPYYRIDDAPQYQSFIPKNAIKRDSFENMSSGMNPGIMKFIKDHFFIYNLIYTFNWKYKDIKEFAMPRADLKVGSGNEPTSSKSYAGYFDSSIDQQKAAIFYLDKIITEEKGKPVIIVSIPELASINRARDSRNHDDYKSQFWYRHLTEASRNKNVYFLDLMNLDEPSPENLFLKCDGHWSPYGNQLAAEKISDFIKTNLKGLIEANQVRKNLHN